MANVNKIRDILPAKGSEMCMYAHSLKLSLDKLLETGTLG
jgi:hypothetical protein